MRQKVFKIIINRFLLVEHCSEVKLQSHLYKQLLLTKSLTVSLA